MANPCDGTKLPKVQRKQVVPLTTEQVAAVRDALPPQLQALVTLNPLAITKVTKA